MSASAAAVARTSRAPASRSGSTRSTARAAGRAEPQRPSRTWSVLLAAAAVAVTAGLRVWTGLLFADLGYEHVRAVDLGQRLENERQALEDELAGLRNTDFLEAEAGRRLGLGPPSAGQVVDLRSEVHVAVATVAGTSEAIAQEPSAEPQLAPEHGTADVRSTDGTIGVRP